MTAAGTHSRGKCSRVTREVAPFSVDQADQEVADCQETDAFCNQEWQSYLGRFAQLVFRCPEVHKQFLPTL